MGGLARGRLDPRDAAVSALLTEVAGLLMDCAARCDGELPGFLRARVLPQLQLSPALQVLSRALIWVPHKGNAASMLLGSGSWRVLFECNPDSYLPLEDCFSHHASALLQMYFPLRTSIPLNSTPFGHALAQRLDALSYYPCLCTTSKEAICRCNAFFSKGVPCMPFISLWARADVPI